jgi:hypothetical protein
MDRLMMLNPVVSYEANAQADELCHLIEMASRENRSFIRYEMPSSKSMHPLVNHILTSKGFLIKEENSFMLPTKAYIIYIE